jgi:hypothetical protein
VTIAQLVAAIEAERARADALHPGTSDLPDSSDNPNGCETWERIAKLSCDRAQKEGRLTFAHVLAEEAAECATAAAKGDVATLRKELVEVAAVCFKWICAIDRRVDLPATSASGEGGTA